MKKDKNKKIKRFWKHIESSITIPLLLSKRFQRETLTTQRNIMIGD